MLHSSFCTAIQVSRIVLLAAAISLVLASTGTAHADQPKANVTAQSNTENEPLGLGRPHKITWDKYSLMIDGNRMFVWSGEFHYFRLPSPNLWRDILQKIKASGFNTVQLYFNWAYHSPKAGVYDFSGIRDIDRLLKEAEDAGLYVLARPGPYINAEVDAGGLPDWVLTDGPLRTDKPCIDTCPPFGSYLSQAKDWLSHVDAIIAKHQFTTGGGSVISYQLENELQETETDEYMTKLATAVRSHGITVPIYTNQTGRWIPASAAGAGGNRVRWNDLYGYDSYPNGFSCKEPSQWNKVEDVESEFRALDQSTPIFSPEFQGGSIDGPGGVGYEKCRQLTGPDFQRVFELTNVANGLTMESNYMTYGGTSWGWLTAPILYTSYDYGAMITEGRQLTSKSAGQKQIGYFLESIEPLRQTDIGSTVIATSVSPDDNTSCKNGTAPDAENLTDCGAIKIYHRVNSTTHTHFYFVRHDESRSMVDSKFNFPISTPDGSYSVPQNGALELDGRDMKVVVANYDLDSTSKPQHLVYSTSNIMTSKQINGQDVLLLWASKGETGETVLRYTKKPTVRTLSGIAPQTAYKNGNLIINTAHDGLSVVRISGGGAAKSLLLLLTDKPTSQTFWMQDTPRGTILESGPQLVRSAKVNGSTLALTGDTDKPAALTVWAPGDLKMLTWNGAKIATRKNPDGSISGRSVLPRPPQVTLPALDHWITRRESPEAQVAFDDSSWKAADHTTTNNPHKPTADAPVLYADDYGYHHGSVWYRGHIKASGPLTSIAVDAATGGRNSFVMVWLNGAYLGSSIGLKKYPVPADAVRTGTDNVISILVTNVAHDQIVHMKGKIILHPTNPRGLRAVTTTPDSAIAWKIQGNKGGEDIADVTRGPMNSGGLYGEREGWSMPDQKEVGWSLTSLPASDTSPGVAWYRTSFALNLPRGIDPSIGLTIVDAVPQKYHAQIFLNGWNLGLYASDTGPQHTFVLPNGILRTGAGDDGKNTVAIAVINPETGSSLGEVSLTALGVTAGGLPFLPAQTTSSVSK